MKRLAQIAYCDLPETNREHYTYDAFVQSLNDLGLHHQLHAREVNKIEDALHEGKVYLLAKQFHRAQVSSQQITTGPDHPVQVAAATTTFSLEAEVDRLITMVEQLVAALARANFTALTQAPLGPRVEVPRSATLCWGCGTRGYLLSSCIQPRKRLNFHGSRKPLHPAGWKKKTSKAENAGRLHGHRVILLMSGKHPGRAVDQCGDRNRSPCLSLTALTGYQR